MSIRFSHGLMLLFQLLHIDLPIEKEIPLENVFNTENEFEAKLPL